MLVLRRRKRKLADDTLYKDARSASYAHEAQPAAPSPDVREVAISDIDTDPSTNKAQGSVATAHAETATPSAGTSTSSRSSRSRRSRRAAKGSSAIAGGTISQSTGSGSRSASRYDHTTSNSRSNPTPGGASSSSGMNELRAPAPRSHLSDTAVDTIDATSVHMARSHIANAVVKMQGQLQAELHDSQLQINSVIGQGGFGTVYQGVHVVHSTRLHLQLVFGLLPL